MASNLALEAEPTLGDLQKYVADMVKERGFQSKDIGQKFMLLLEEVGELAKAARKASGMRFATDSKQSQEAGHEAADALMLLLDICNMLNIDLEQAFRDKEEKNKLRVWE